MNKYWIKGGEDFADCDLCGKDEVKVCFYYSYCPIEDAWDAEYAYCWFCKPTKASIKADMENYYKGLEIENKMHEENND